MYLIFCTVFLLALAGDPSSQMEIKHFAAGGKNHSTYFYGTVQAGRSRNFPCHLGLDASALQQSWVSSRGICGRARLSHMTGSGEFGFSTIALDI